MTGLIAHRRVGCRVRTPRASSSTTRGSCGLMKENGLFLAARRRSLVGAPTRFTMLLHLPRLAGHGSAPRIKNAPRSPAMAPRRFATPSRARSLTLPEQLRRSLTWDQWAEMAQHARLKIEAGVQVYFCDPHSPWQRATNENTNGLLRQYFPKGTDLSIHTAVEIAAVAAALNTRPRKTLEWKTPAEALDRLLLSADKRPIATTV